eukprot:g55331.t1
MLKLKGGKEDSESLKRIKQGLARSAADGANPLIRPGRDAAIAKYKAERERKAAPVVYVKGAGEKPRAETEQSGSDLSDDEDDDNALAAIRAKRLADFRQNKAAAQNKQELQQKGHGSYTEITQSEFVQVTTEQCKFVVCHFFLPSFTRCDVVDKHFTMICKRHLNVRFVKMNAQEAPFWSTKLGVKVLPTILTFKEGVVKDRIVGFEELGGVDDFKTSVLEARLASTMPLTKPKKSSEEEFEDPWASHPTLRRGGGAAASR